MSKSTRYTKLENNSGDAISKVQKPAKTEAKSESKAPDKTLSNFVAKHKEVYMLGQVAEMLVAEYVVKSRIARDKISRDKPATIDFQNKDFNAKYGDTVQHIKEQLKIQFQHFKQTQTAEGLAYTSKTGRILEDVFIDSCRSIFKDVEPKKDKIWSLTKEGGLASSSNIKDAIVNKIIHNLKFNFFESSFDILSNAFELGNLNKDKAFAKRTDNEIALESKDKESKLTKVQPQNQNMNGHKITKPPRLASERLQNPTPTLQQKSVDRQEEKEPVDGQEEKEPAKHLSSKDFENQGAALKTPAKPHAKPKTQNSQVKAGDVRGKTPAKWVVKEVAAFETPSKTESNKIQNSQVTARDLRAKTPAKWVVKEVAAFETPSKTESNKIQNSQVTARDLRAKTPAKWVVKEPTKCSSVEEEKDSAEKVKSAHPAQVKAEAEAKAAAQEKLSFAEMVTQGRDARETPKSPRTIRYEAAKLLRDQRSDQSNQSNHRG